MRPLVLFLLYSNPLINPSFLSKGKKKKEERKKRKNTPIEERFKIVISKAR